MNRETVHELRQVLVEHFHVSENEKHDITAILNTRDTLEIIQGIDLERYDESYINYDGEFHLVSSCPVGDATYFYVESVEDEEYGLKHDETNILIIPNYLPQEIKDHFVNANGYDKLIELNDFSTYEELIKKIEN